ncbi:hypothetical protein Q3G72_016618 [Acer saccharum]|nr:hypothetical protein Q3G72_016618 [Acer saccharum]
MKIGWEFSDNGQPRGPIVLIGPVGPGGSGSRGSVYPNQVDIFGRGKIISDVTADNGGGGLVGCGSCDEGGGDDIGTVERGKIEN